MFELSRSDPPEEPQAIPDWFVVELAKTLGLSLDDAYDKALELQAICWEKHRNES